VYKYEFVGEVNHPVDAAFGAGEPQVSASICQETEGVTLAQFNCTEVAKTADVVKVVGGGHVGIVEKALGPDHKLNPAVAPQSPLT
jgi:hypothetical protein